MSLVLKVIIASILVVPSVALADPSPTAARTPFTDIGSSAFAGDIDWAFNTDITAGCTTTKFCPKSVVTREQMASFLDRMFHLAATSRDYFSDDNASLHEAAINRVAAAGVTDGCATGKYCPRAQVTREQMASFIARAAELKTGSGRNYFSDDNGRAHESNIDRIAAAGIGSGCGPFRFCPTAPVTREQMAAFLHRVVAPVAPPPYPAMSSAAVLVGAGDIATCSRLDDEATAKLLDSIAGTVITLGDNVYDDGTATEFAQCYGPSWGRHKARTKPTPGNHDYHVPEAAGYFSYFGNAARPGYYAYNVGTWRVYSLNSEVISSTQLAWLRNDLAANPRRCVAAYWHTPRFATPYPNGTHGAQTEVEPLWDALADAGAELVLNAHNHHYERFAPNRGVTQVIVGTGGAGLDPFSTSIAAGSVVRNATTNGVIKVTLSSTGYSAQFVPVAGQSFTDRFSGSCH